MQSSEVSSASNAHAHAHAHSKARTVAIFTPTPSNTGRYETRAGQSSRTTAPGLRRRSSHDDLKVVAYYSDKPLPPRPLQPKTKTERPSGRTREAARLDKPLPRLPDQVPFVQTLGPFKFGPGKFREGSERRDVHVVEAPPAQLPSHAAVLFPASPPRTQRKRDRLAKLLGRKDSIQEMTAVPEEVLAGLYADGLFR